MYLTPCMLYIALMHAYIHRYIERDLKIIHKYNQNKQTEKITNKRRSNILLSTWTKKK